jgi:hypothetical protein
VAGTLAVLPTFLQEIRMAIHDIAATLRTYFDVMYDCDMGKFDQVFHPACSLFTHGGDALVVRPYRHYREEMSVRPSPRAAGQSRALERILKIDMLSDEMALAQVRVQIHDKVFVDNLNLVQVAGRWMIVAKIYHHAGAPAVEKS